MEEKSKKGKVKLRTKKGTIYTIDISNYSDSHISGTDKKGLPVKIPLKDIDEMYPITSSASEVSNGK